MTSGRERRIMREHARLIRYLVLLPGVAAFIINSLIIDGVIVDDGSPLVGWMHRLSPNPNEHGVLLLCWLRRFIRIERNSQRRWRVFSTVIRAAISFSPFPC